MESDEPTDLIDSLLEYDGHDIVTSGAAVLALDGKEYRGGRVIAHDLGSHVQIELPDDDSPVMVRAYSYEDMRRKVDRRGLGGHVVPTTERLVPMHELADTLVRRVAGTSTRSMGMGSGYRDNLRLTREAAGG